MKALVLLLLTIGLLSNCSRQDSSQENSSQGSIYVSTLGHDNNGGTKDYPVQSLSKVRELIVVQALKPETDTIYVYLAAGTYFLQQIFMIDADLTQGKPLQFLAESKGNVIISGAKQIRGFKKNAQGLWEASIEDRYFPQLYLKNKKAIRARVPNQTDLVSYLSFDKVKNRRQESRPAPDSIYLYHSQVLPAIKDVDQTEIVIMKDWATNRQSLLMAANGFINLKPPFSIPKKATQQNTLSNEERAKGFTFYLEGDISFIDQPTEWAIYDSKLYYMPEAGTLVEKFEAYVPLLEQLFLVKGTSKNIVNHITFKGITFAHSGYLIPPTGYDGAQSAAYYYTSKASFEQNKLGFNFGESALITLNYAQNCHFLNCLFTQSARHGIYLSAGAKHNVIAECEFAAIGANAVMVGNLTDTTAEQGRVEGNQVIRNHIHDVGVSYPSGVGIWLGYAADNAILENEIYDTPYSGITSGWQWNPLPSSASGNKINSNHVRHVMKVLGDGGGIYVLGYQPGSEINNNKIHDVLRNKLNHGSPNNGLYFDQGSKGYVASGNLIYNIAHTPVRGHRSAGVLIENNTFVYNDTLAGVSHSPPYVEPLMINEDGKYEWPKPDWLKEDCYADTIFAFELKGNKYIKASKWAGPDKD